MSDNFALSDVLERAMKTTVTLPEGVEIGEFKPCVVHFEEGDFSQLLLEDCATVTGWPPVIVEPLYRMNSQDGSREIVGFQWYGKDPQPVAAAPASAEPVKTGYDATMDKIDYVMDSRGEIHKSFMLMFRDDKADHRLFRRPSEARPINIVKPLAWVEDRFSGKWQRFTAESVLGCYEALEWSDGGFGGSVPSQDGSGVEFSSPSMEEAKAFAQADFEARIRSALSIEATP